MSVVIARDIPDAALAGKRERLLAMVDLLEGVPPEELRALARRSAFTGLEVRDAPSWSPPTSTQRGCSCCWRGGPRSMRTTVWDRS